MELLLQNPFSVTLLAISTVLILLAIFSTRIHKVSEKSPPTYISCPECNQKIKLSTFGKKIDACPLCHEKLIPNKKRLVCFYFGAVILGVSLFFEKEVRWIFQLIYVALIFIGFAIKEFKKPCEK
jgi:uncharacterized paraquat-inducible protein A